MTFESKAMKKNNTHESFLRKYCIYKICKMLRPMCPNFFAHNILSAGGVLSANPQHSLIAHWHKAIPFFHKLFVSNLNLWFFLIPNIWTNQVLCDDVKANWGFWMSILAFRTFFLEISSHCNIFVETIDLANLFFTVRHLRER